MTILLVDGSVLDDGLSSLNTIIELFDPHIVKLSEQIKHSNDG
jgi:hypothetical protein